MSLIHFRTICSNFAFSSTLHLVWIQTRGNRGPRLGRGVGPQPNRRCVGGGKVSGRKWWMAFSVPCLYGAYLEMLMEGMRTTRSDESKKPMQLCSYCRSVSMILPLIVLFIKRLRNNHHSNCCPTSAAQSFYTKCWFDAVTSSTQNSHYLGNLATEACLCSCNPVGVWNDKAGDGIAGRYIARQTFCSEETNRGYEQSVFCVSSRYSSGSSIPQLWLADGMSQFVCDHSLCLPLPSFHLMLYLIFVLSLSVLFYWTTFYQLCLIRNTSEPY